MKKVCFESGYFFIVKHVVMMIRLFEAITSILQQVHFNKKFLPSSLLSFNAQIKKTVAWAFFNFNLAFDFPNV
jgi:hypothetical protein